MATYRRSNSRSYSSGRSAGRGYSGSYYSSNAGSHSATAYSPSKFSTARQEVQAKICSFRAIQQQFNSSASRVTAFSPSGANKWIRLVNTGARVYTFGGSQFSRYFGQRWNQASPTTAFKLLRRRFGASIKAVTRGKGNNWLVAATPSVSSRPFTGYNWK